MAQYEQWEGFKGRLWKDDVDVRDFIQNNYVPYEGDASFLADATEDPLFIWYFSQTSLRECPPTR